MSGGTSQQSSQQASSGALDPEFKALYMGNKDRATRVADALKARQFAGFTPDQTTGFGITRQTATQMPGMRAVDAALQRTGEVGSMTADQLSGGSILNRNIASYMNPYTNEVVDRSLSDIARQRDIALNANQAKVTAANAFGNTRRGIQEASVVDPYAKAMSDTAAQLRQQGYTQATGLATGDIDRETQARQTAANLGLSAAQLGAQLGAQQQAMGYEAGKQIADVGAQQQALTQAQLDAIRNLPLEQQQIINQALGLNVGGGSGMVSTSQGTSSGESSQGSIGLLSKLTGGLF